MPGEKLFLPAPSTIQHPKPIALPAATSSRHPADTRLAHSHTAARHRGGVAALMGRPGVARGAGDAAPARSRVFTFQFNQTPRQRTLGVTQSTLDKLY